MRQAARLGGAPCGRHAREGDRYRAVGGARGGASERGRLSEGVRTEACLRAETETSRAAPPPDAPDAAPLRHAGCHGTYVPLPLGGTTAAHSHHGHAGSAEQRKGAPVLPQSWPSPAVSVPLRRVCAAHVSRPRPERGLCPAKADVFPTKRTRRAEDAAARATLPVRCPPVCVGSGAEAPASHSRAAQPAGRATPAATAATHHTRPRTRGGRPQQRPRQPPCPTLARQALLGLPPPAARAHPRAPAPAPRQTPANRRPSRQHATPRREAGGAGARASGGCGEQGGAHQLAHQARNFTQQQPRACLSCACSACCCHAQDAAAAARAHSPFSIQTETLLLRQRSAPHVGG